MKQNDDWDAWASDFRSEVDSRAQPADVARLVERASRDTWRHRAKLGVELLSYAFGLVVFGTLSARVPGVWPFAAFVSAAFVIAAAYTMHVRNGTWAAAGGEVSSFVELACRRKRDDVRMARLGLVLLLLLSLGLAVWLPFFVATTPDPKAGTWLAVPTRLVFAAVTLLGTALYLRHKLGRERVALARLEAIRASLEGGSESVREG